MILVSSCWNKNCIRNNGHTLFILSLVFLKTLILSVAFFLGHPVLFINFMPMCISVLIDFELKKLVLYTVMINKEVIWKIWMVKRLHTSIWKASYGWIFDTVFVWMMFMKQKTKWFFYEFFLHQMKSSFPKGVRSIFHESWCFGLNL